LSLSWERVTGADLKRRIEQFMRIVIRAGVLPVAVGIGILTGSHLRAQTPNAAETASRSFDVASIKPNKSGNRNSGTNIRTGGLTATNVTLRSLIRDGYRVQDFQILNASDWLDNDRFDVAAKAEGEATPDQIRAMLQALLVERFKFVAHRETREMGVYNLVPARTDGRLGDGLRQSACESGKCGNTNTNNLVLRGEGITLDRFAEWLSQTVSRVVHNKTRLDGPFDIDLAWSNDSAADSSRPSIFTALPEQLGLKLESTRAPVDVLVIDHVEQPTPD
jgi:uncharacterized protein (TIGR03435 family)